MVNKSSNWLPKYAICNVISIILDLKKVHAYGKCVKHNLFGTFFYLEGVAMLPKADLDDKFDNMMLFYQIKSVPFLFC